MDRKLKVGIIGFGGAGIALYNQFNSIKGCKTLAIYDPKQGGLDRARKSSKTMFM